MDLFTLGNGSIHVDWNGVEGESGLEPRLILKGHLVAKGYAIGALLQVSAKVTATEIEGNSALLGSTVPEFYALNWVKNRPNVEGLPPADETPWDLRLPLPLSSAVIEGLEARRHGRDFWLQLDVKFVLVDKGEVHDGAHPLMTSQTTFKVSQNDWAQVLERWERGVGITVLLPLAAGEPDPERAKIVRHLKDARQKIDGADYAGSFASSRKALELLRKLGPFALTGPTVPKERDVNQRIRAVLDALYSLASASPHVDAAVEDFEPTRADAVALVGATMSTAQEVFARIEAR
jgi:hypothetical protein